MNQKDILARLKHVDFPTQQRRLRHLRSVAARNLTLAKRLCKLSGINKLGVFFTLHRDEQTPAFYTSETITGSLNPTWRSFSIRHMESDVIDSTHPFVVVRVWQGGETGDAVITLQWNTHLSGLCFLGYQIKREDVHYSSNTLILGLHDGFYAAPPDEELIYGRSFTAVRCNVEQVLIKASYSPHSLARIQTVLCALQQTKASVNRVKHNITSRLHHCVKTQTKKAEKESSLFRVNKLRADLESRTVKLQTLKEKYEVKQTTSYQREIGVKNKFEKLQKDLLRLNEKKKAYFEIREGHIKTGAQLVMRRKQLISELSCIYPIHQINEDTFTICHVELPNSEAFYGRNETMIAVSLGYTCHLVTMISLFLDVPLRYPTDNLGSRSQIHDHVIDKLADKERNFPLFSKGKEKFQFQYGVYLLNKNIAQLRYYCGLGTADLRMTLANLQTLLQLRLGVKFESGGQAAARTNLKIPTDETDMACVRSTLDSGGVITKGNSSSSDPLDSPESDQNSSQSSKALDSMSHSRQNSPDDQDEPSAGVNIQDILHSKQTFPLNNDSVLEVNDTMELHDNSVSDGMFGSLHSARLTALSSGYEASSSEDSGSCGSHFKRWPGATSFRPLTSDEPIRDLLDNDTPSMECPSIQQSSKPQDINPDFMTRTFKTKAMCHPKAEDKFASNNQDITNITRIVPAEKESRSQDKLDSSDELATFSVPYLLPNNTSSSSDLDERCHVTENNSSDQ